MYNLNMDVKNYYIEFCNNVRAEKARKGLSRQQLAEKAGISIDTMGQIERGEGNPQFNTMVSIALALDVDLNTLLPLKK